MEHCALEVTSYVNFHHLLPVYASCRITFDFACVISAFIKIVYSILSDCAIWLLASEDSTSRLFLGAAVRRTSVTL
jgi:hypothetical protein